MKKDKKEITKMSDDNKSLMDEISNNLDKLFEWNKNILDGKMRWIGMEKRTGTISEYPVFCHNYC